MYSSSSSPSFPEPHPSFSPLGGAKDPPPETAFVTPLHLFEDETDLTAEVNSISPGTMKSTVDRSIKEPEITENTLESGDLKNEGNL